MKTLMIAGAALLSSALAVSAQTAGSSATTGRAATAPAAQANASQANTSPSGQAAPATNEPLRQQVRDNLTKAGFTDIRIMPTSFLIRAKDQSGNPVMMVINPDSFTEVTAVPATNPNTAQNNSGANTQKH